MAGTNRGIFLAALVLTLLVALTSEGCRRQSRELVAEQMRSCNEYIIHMMPTHSTAKLRPCTPKHQKQPRASTASSALRSHASRHRCGLEHQSPVGASSPRAVLASTRSSKSMTRSRAAVSASATPISSTRVGHRTVSVHLAAGSTTGVAHARWLLLWFDCWPPVSCGVDPAQLLTYLTCAQSRQTIRLLAARPKKVQNIHVQHAVS